MALVVPAAQARPIGVPVPTMHTHTPVRTTMHTHTPVGTSILKDKLQLPPPVTRTSVSHSIPTIVASDSGFNWTDAVIGAAFASILIGLGISGMQMNHAAPHTFDSDSPKPSCAHAKTAHEGARCVLSPMAGVSG
jgi:hypothetical protein